MKVICIDDKADPLACENAEPLVLGEVYTVIRYSEYSINKYGVAEKFPVYCLAERGYGFGYAVERFIPVSNIDETEFVRNYNKQLV